MLLRKYKDWTHIKIRDSNFKWLPFVRCFHLYCICCGILAEIFSVLIFNYILYIDTVSTLLSSQKLRNYLNNKSLFK